MSSEFKGFTKIELEMLRDELDKALPGVLAIIPTFAQLIKANHSELINQGYSGSNAMYLAVQAAGKILNIGN